MKTTKFRVFNAVLIVALALSLVAFVQPAQAVSPDIVISQVYGGGGNTGAPYTNDFVELFNRGTTTVSLSWLVHPIRKRDRHRQFWINHNSITPLSGSLAPGQYYLVQERSASGGATALPTPDVTDSLPIAMAAQAARLRLSTQRHRLGCNGRLNTLHCRLNWL